MKTPSVRFLRDDEWPAAMEILREAARWSARFGDSAWTPAELSRLSRRQSIGPRERVGGFESEDLVACMLLEARDDIYWPDDPPGEALYLHKLAVRRAFAGQGWAQRMIEFAAAECRLRGARALRLDTIPDTRLPALYSEMGFRAVDPEPHWFLDRRLVRMELLLR